MILMTLVHYLMVQEYIRWWECDVCEISDDEDNVPLAVERVEDERKHKLFDREEVALKYNTRCIV